MRRALAAGACVLAGACAHVSPPPDPVLADLEHGTRALRDGDRARARTHLSRALARFDDLALDGGALEHALASDPKKPYRGRPHERVLTALLVAALDAEAGRCDMAPASLRNARYFAAKAHPSDEATLPLADAIERACAQHEALAIELAGAGPRFSASGAHGEALSVSPGSGDDVWARIVIGGPADEAPRAVWSSTYEAQHASGRRFDDVLAERARSKTQADGVRHTQVSAGLEAIGGSVRDGSLGGDKQALSTAALRIGVGVVAGVAGAAIDARVDTRFVHGLPESVRIAGPAAARAVVCAADDPQ